MAVHFCDGGLGTGADDGSSFDAAFKLVKSGFEHVYTTTDVCWVRRRSSFGSPAADITLSTSSDATTAAPIRLIAWPRATKAIASSDWTNGSTAVVDDDSDLTRGAHQGRYITAPDGRQYLITRVIDASNFVIDREYVGATVTGQAATIAADDYYDEAQAIDDSAWTIKKADWNADPDTLPVIGFGANAFNLTSSGGNGPWYIQGFDFQDSTDTNGTVYFSVSKNVNFVGCLFSQTQNSSSLRVDGQSSVIDRCIFEGNSTGSSQNLVKASEDVIIKNAAIYNAGGSGLMIGGSSIMLDDVNIGVEQANDSYDIIQTSNYAGLLGRDVKLGGTNGLVRIYNIGNDKNARMRFENYQRILGAQRTFISTASYSERRAVVAGSGDPYKRTSGADDVLAIILAASDAARFPGWEICLAEFRFWADTSSKSYRVYCQQVAMATLTAAQLFAEATYCDGYDDTSEYHMARVVSDETVAVRSGADDWSQYIEVTGIQPAVAGWVTLKVMAQWYDTDGYLYIDPLVVIS